MEAPELFEEEERVAVEASRVAVEASRVAVEASRVAVEAYVRTLRESRKPGSQASAQAPQPGQCNAPPQGLQTKPVQYMVSQ